MELITFWYTPSAYVNLTGADLALLHECSLHHYDAKCRSLSDKGQLTGFVNMFIMEHAGGLSKGVEFCEENPTLTTEVKVDTRDLDTWMKLLELGGHLGPDKAMKAVDLSMSLKRLFQQLNEEFSRLNPKAED